MIDERVAGQQFFQRAVGGRRAQTVLGVGFEQRQQELTRSRRRRALQIFEGGLLELDVVRVKGAEGNSHGIARQHKREQGEEMFEIAVGAVQHLVVEEPGLFLWTAGIEQVVGVAAPTVAGTTRGSRPPRPVRGPG